RHLLSAAPGGAHSRPDAASVDDGASIAELYRTASALYISTMSSINVTDARARFSEILRTSRTEAVVVERHGLPEAVLISPEEYERLMDIADEADDVRAFDAAMAEDGESIPWAQVKADLGWG
ncbi:MAG: type II toxin-antitoxin system Phd/YefM family antitoxin, partial [Phycicoccus sp.]